MNHREAWDLIPWLVNDSLDAARRAALEQHLGDCPACRGEVQAQRELMHELNSRPLVEAMPRASLQRLWARLDAGVAPARRAAAAAGRARAPAPRWILAAAGILLVLGASLAMFAPWRAGPAADYRTVAETSDSPAPGSIRAVFAGGMTVAELQALLQETGLHAVSGPTASGVYTLAPVTARDAPAALAVLRAHPGVRFAEPVTR
jgi:anti-sigma factor RsiW